MRSPYLWSCTIHYERGKYVSDGKFDPQAVSLQVGCAAILKGLQEAGEEIFGVVGKPKPVATWIEEFRLDGGERVIVAWDAGGAVIEKLKTYKTKEISDFYSRHTQARTSIIAPFGKLIPT
jgi:hypothetical protein